VVLAAVRRAAPAGVAFAATTFTPRRPGDGKYADTLLAGIRLRVTDRSLYDPTRTAVVLLSIIRAQQPDRFRWLAAQFDRLAGGPRLREALEAGASPAAVTGAWAAALRRFERRRAPFLLYPE
jgi:uncharacterized protein YbbC (DUF1343 family)